MSEIKKLSDYFHYKGNGEEGYAEVKTYSPDGAFESLERFVFAYSKHILPNYPFNQIKFLAKVNSGQSALDKFDSAGNKLVHVILMGGRITENGTFQSTRNLAIIKNLRLPVQSDPSPTSSFENECFTVTIDKEIYLEQDENGNVTEDICMLFVPYSEKETESGIRINNYINWFTDNENGLSIVEAINKKILSANLEPDSGSEPDFSRLESIGTHLVDEPNGSFARSMYSSSISLNKCIKTIFSRKVTGFDIVKRIDDVSIHRELSAEAADFINKLVNEYTANGQSREDVIQNIIDLNNNTFVVADEETP